MGAGSSTFSVTTGATLPDGAAGVAPVTLTVSRSAVARVGNRRILLMATIQRLFLWLSIYCSVNSPNLSFQGFLRSRKSLQGDRKKQKTLASERQQGLLFAERRRRSPPMYHTTPLTASVRAIALGSNFWCTPILAEEMAIDPEVDRQYHAVACHVISNSKQNPTRKRL